MKKYQKKETRMEWIRLKVNKERYKFSICPSHKQEN